jgi:hypothetical protein
MFMNRMKMGALGLLAAGTLAVGVVTLASSATRPPGRDEADPPRGGALPGTGKPVPKLIPVKTGDLLRIDVLEALPGRPLAGTRIVRPDGTISLGFYGDLYVDGLNRDQIKVKLIERLRRFLNDEVLGLVEQDEEGKWRMVDPVDSDRVFVEDHFYQRGDQERRLEALETKMGEILAAVRRLGKAPVAPPPAATPRPRDDEAPQPQPQPQPKPEPKPDPDLPPIPSVPFPAPTRVQVPDSDPFPAPPPVPVPAPAPTRAPVPASDPSSSATAGTAHEGRLREMERKLDRILERIEGGGGGRHD